MLIAQVEIFQPARLAIIICDESSANISSALARLLSTAALTAILMRPIMDRKTIIGYLCNILIGCIKDQDLEELAERFDAFKKEYELNI